MELAIIPRYEETVLNLTNPSYVDKFRILEIDGVFLTTVWVLEKGTNKLMEYLELAFASLIEAKNYLINEHDLVIDDREKEHDDWREYDTDE